MKSAGILVFCLFHFLGTGQVSWNSLISDVPPPEYRTSSILYRIGMYARENPSDLRERVKKQNMIIREDGRIYTEFVMGDDLQRSIDRQLLEAMDIEVNNTWKNRASCWVSPDDLLHIAVHLPADYLMNEVRKLKQNNEGPGVMNTTNYVNNGADGAGIVIGIIDGGYDLLTEAIAAGAINSFFLSFDWTGDGLEEGGVHGTACFETIVDHAPGANYNIHKISSTSDFGNAVDAAIDGGTNIISSSMSWYNQGWDDNSGPICSAVEDAANEDILVFVSAGNDNGSHWQGNFDDDDGDDIHEWSGSDEGNNFIVSNNTTADVFLQWDGGSALNYYDLQLVDASTGDLLESSNNAFDFESLSWYNDTGSDQEVYIRVLHILFGTPEFEVSSSGAGTDLQYASSYGATVSPSNSTESNCISVGAVAYTNYQDPTGTSNIASYSSHGPTNGNLLAPDVVGPTNTTTFAYGGAFGGTSCATPNVAGAVAAFWSANLYLSDTGVRNLIKHMASLYNDWGDPGDENIYGYGGVRMCDFAEVTRFVDQQAGNILESSSLPYIKPEDADQHAPEDATIRILGGIYNVEDGFIFTKPLLYTSIIEDSVMY